MLLFSLPHQKIDVPRDMKKRLTAEILNTINLDKIDVEVFP